MNKRGRPGDYLALTKIKIMIPVSLTGFTGFFTFDPHFTARLWQVSIGVLLMAISASVLNQIQETGFDRKMERTRTRPLADKRISLTHATIFFLVNLIAGTAILYFAGNLKAALTGLFTIFWYNCVYTYAKRITPFAVVPGALTGALPPLIGWLAAGGGFMDKPIIFIGFLIFIGQIPHFWLLVLKYNEDYKNAGFPTISDLFSNRQINRLTFTWVLTSVCAALYLCYFEIIQNRAVMIFLAATSAFLVWQFTFLLRTAESTRPGRKYSIILNLYFLAVILLLISDKIIG